MFKMIIIFLILTSCTISRYYKTKDIKKNFHSYEKNMNKSIRSIDSDLNYQKKVISEISIYKLDKEIIENLRSDLKKCVEVKNEVANQQLLYKTRFQSLDLKGKKISSTESRYKEIEKFKKFVKTQNKSINKSLEKYRAIRKEFYGRLQKKQFKLVKTKDVKKQFESYNKKFRGEYLKTKKSISMFRKKISESQHKKKDFILQELLNLDKILEKLEESNLHVNSVVKSFHQKYGAHKELIHGPNSPTYQSLEKIKQEFHSLNIRVKEFNVQSKKINKIIKE